MLLIGGPKQCDRKEPSMMIIGCDYQPSWQQICWLDTATGETGEKKLEHASGEAERFYG
jgi:transposase